jgi:CYTH domain-containing protein
MGMRTARDEAERPKYAHVERERRWRVDPARRPALDGVREVLIEDRYIADTRCRLRRMTDVATGEQSHKLTRKYDAADPRARPIVTAYMTADEYDVFALLPALPLSKRRFAVASDGHIWSIDRFEGALTGLETMEIEWPDDAGLRGLTAPGWTVREVSNDSRYQGGSLALHGIPEE